MGALGSVESELDAVVSEATTFADLASKYATAAGKLASDLPGSLGSDATEVVGLINDVDKALNALKAALAG
jgi:hypothetical protein